MFKRWLFQTVWAADTDGTGGSSPPGGSAAPAAGAGNPAAAASSAPGAPAVVATAGAPPVFAETLPTDLRELPVFKDIKDLDGLARSYANAAKMVGMDKGRVVALPAEGDDAAWGELYGKLGRPADAKEYGFKPPEGVTVDTKLQDGFAGKAHELGLNTKQATALYEWWNGEAAAARAAQDAQSGAALEAVTTALKTEWGTAYDQNLDLAKKAVAHYGSPKLSAELEAGAGNNVEIVKLFAKLGRGLSEDGLIGRAGSGGEALNSPTEARQQINALKDDQAFLKAYTNKSDPGHKAAVDKMAGLYAQAYPEPASA